MKKEERVEYIKSKQGKSIWSIKNRWLRAAVAWVVAIILAAFLAVAIPVTAIVGAIRGAWDGPAEFVNDFDEWSDLLANMWAAMTGRKPEDVK